MRLKRVLLVCPYFPPQNCTGARRATAFAKYLGEYGWDVKVLTGCSRDDPFLSNAPEDSANHLGVNESKIMRVDTPSAPVIGGSAGRFHKGLRALEALWGGPGSHARRWARSLLGQIDHCGIEADVIWATYPHLGPFYVASSLSKKLNVPWIGDFRDIPDQMKALPSSARWLGMMRARQLTGGAAHRVAVSPYMTERLRSRHGPAVSTIANGFDPQLLCEHPLRPSDEVFTIVYTGNVLGARYPRPVVCAVDELVSEGTVSRNKIELLFYTRTSLERICRDCDIANIKKPPRVQQWVPAHEAASVQRAATVLLLLSEPRVGGVLTTKLFEYMAAGRPVIAYPADPNDIDAVLTSTGIGVSCNSKRDLKQVLADWYHQWEETGDIHVERQPTEIAKWSRKEQAGQLAKLLDSITA